MDAISIAIPISTFERLQAEAVPLVDPIDSVLLRLLDHDKAHQPAEPGFTRHVANIPTGKEAKTFKTSRGVLLPIMSLHAKYDGEVVRRPRMKTRTRAGGAAPIEETTAQ